MKATENKGNTKGQWFVPCLPYCSTLAKLKFLWPKLRPQKTFFFAIIKKSQNHEHKRFGFSQSSRKLKFLWPKLWPKKTFFFCNHQEKSVFFVKGVNTKGLVFPITKKVDIFVAKTEAPKNLFFCNHQEKSGFFVKTMNIKGLVFPNHQERWNFCGQN